MSAPVKNFTRLLVAASICLYILSLTTECYCTANNCGASFLVLLLGWAGIFMGSMACLSWLANPLLIMSWLTAKKNPRASLGYSSVAALLTLSFLLFDKIVDNEAGGFSKIISYKSGYWLWSASIILMVVGNYVLSLKAEKSFEKKSADKI